MSHQLNQSNDEVVPNRVSSVTSGNVRDPPVNQTMNAQEYYYSPSMIPGNFQMFDYDFVTTDRDALTINSVHGGHDIEEFMPNYVNMPPLQQVSVSDGEDTPEKSPYDNVSQHRKDRRRAQNRAAQRAFRARKEETIKESSARLEALQEELNRLQTTNGNLSETVDALKEQSVRLQKENAALRRSSTDNISDWANFDTTFVRSSMADDRAPSSELDYQPLSSEYGRGSDENTDMLDDVKHKVQRTLDTQATWELPEVGASSANYEAADGVSEMNPGRRENQTGKD